MGSGLFCGYGYMGLDMLSEIEDRNAEVGVYEYYGVFEGCRARGDQVDESGRKLAQVGECREVFLAVDGREQQTVVRD